MSMICSFYLVWVYVKMSQYQSFFMSVSSNQEGFQLYTGNYVRFTPGKEGRWYQQNEGICIETQSFPDSPNQESFPSVVLHPGEQYEARTVYAFYNYMKNR